MTDQHDPCRIADQAEVDAIRDDYPGLYAIIEGNPLANVFRVRQSAALELVGILRRLRAAEEVCEAEVEFRATRSAEAAIEATRRRNRALDEWKAVHQ